MKLLFWQGRMTEDAVIEDLKMALIFPERNMPPGILPKPETDWRGDTKPDTTAAAMRGLVKSFSEMRAHDINAPLLAGDYAGFLLHPPENLERDEVKACLESARDGERPFRLMFDILLTGIPKAEHPRMEQAYCSLCNLLDKAAGTALAVPDPMKAPKK